MSDTATGHIRVIVTGSEQADVDTAVNQLTDLTSQWGGKVSVAPAGESDMPDSARKVIDPMSVAALIISIPAALLAVTDLADRIGKRRRAAQLTANPPAADSTARAYLIIDGQLHTLSSIQPDQLLNLANTAS